MSLTPEETAQYSKIIDGILATADLNTISAKQIRKGLQAQLDHDIAEQKQAIQALILERFDAFTSEQDGAAATTTAASASPIENGSAMEKTSEKRQSHSDEEDGQNKDISPKKKRKAEMDDAKLAAMLQAQENNRARPTRGGVNKKAVVMRKKAPKKKSAAKVKSADDSDLELGSDGEPKEVSRKGGFHKQYNLSAPLAELVGESTLSRPQVVKKIWEYIKERDLQDPTDKRQIICDYKMQSVFKQERVHMFTMNKILGKQLYDIDE
ncbi:SWIB/MDM2 domain-containing protein [Xylogone sp. PMI_703]|nr:SWIB/MDM2 domain-containing protein [Xylogone sp. PMI_703]